MKIAFDENVPIGMVRVFQTLAKERQLRRTMGAFEIVSAKEYTPDPIDADYVKKSDVPWLERFAADGGKIIISGNTKMLDVPHERMALEQNRFVSVFFYEQWNGWNYFRKCSLLLHYWPVIAKRVKTAKPGTIFRVPSHWKDDGDLVDVARTDQKISKTAPSASRSLPGSSKGDRVRRGRSDVRKQATKDRPSSSRRVKDARQGEIDFPSKSR